jgi:hypothetical protein
MLVKIVVGEIPVLALSHDVGEIPDACDIGTFIERDTVVK